MVGSPLIMRLLSITYIEFARWRISLAQKLAFDFRITIVNLKYFFMKMLIKSFGVLAAVFLFQAAQAQLGVKATTSAAANATLNATKATGAAVNATNKATVATRNAVKATTGAVKQTSTATIKSGEKVKSNTKIEASGEANIKSNNKAGANSNAGGEEKGLIRAKSVTETDAHVNANATLPMKEAKDEMKTKSEEAKKKQKMPKALQPGQK